MIVAMPAYPPIQVYPTEYDLAHASAEKITRVAIDARSNRGKCSIVLAGGETPRRVYRLLGTEPLKHSVEWDRIRFLFGDERMVPVDDPQSNFGMVQREFFSHLLL